MTPADHAKKVREAMYAKEPRKDDLERVHDHYDFVMDQGEVALDALVAQAETAEKREWEYHELWHAETDRAEAAEAERDHARAALLWVNETHPKVMREMPTELFQPLRAALSAREEPRDESGYPGIQGLEALGRKAREES